MGLLRSNLQAIAPLLRGARVLSLGYPDLVATPAEITATLGVEPAPPHPITHHPESLETFARAGAQLHVVDRERYRGFEEVVDLNQPHQLGQYDLVLDAGTLEHCFCPGTALLNAAGAVRPGGHIYHTPPMTMMNHGFYNLCPTLFADFYHANGWEILSLIGYEKKGRGDQFAVPPTARFQLSTPECVLHVLARRADGKPLRIPVQTKYGGRT